MIIQRICSTHNYQSFWNSLPLEIQTAPADVQKYSAPFQNLELILVMLINFECLLSCSLFSRNVHLKMKFLFYLFLGDKLYRIYWQLVTYCGDIQLASPMVVKDAAFQCLISCFRVTRLQFLDLSMATINLTGLQELLSGCQHLRKLSLETCPVNDLICR